MIKYLTYNLEWMSHVVLGLLYVHLQVSVPLQSHC